MEKKDINRKFGSHHKNDASKGLRRRRGNPDFKRDENQKCSKCERWSLSIGLCPFCAAKWFAPVYHK